MDDENPEQLPVRKQKHRRYRTGCFTCRQRSAQQSCHTMRSGIKDHVANQTPEKNGVMKLSAR